MTSNITTLVNIPSKPVLISTLTASGAVSAGLCVTYAGAVAGAGVACAGIANEDAVDTGVFSAVTAGEAVAIAGGTITLGAQLTPNSSGKLIVTTTTGDYVLGRALQTASANQPFRMIITQEGKLP